MPATVRQCVGVMIYELVATLQAWEARFGPIVEQALSPSPPHLAAIPTIGLSSGWPPLEP